jgi:lipopolysaccharide transport system ATP-binding protein
MSDVAIRAEGLGKQYRFGAQAPQRNLREALMRLGAAPYRAAARLWRRPAPAPGAWKRGELFWALKDVSFEVRQGEVVGIVGRNGAGKSTLLKVVSQITEPSAGQLELYGRVASLLEVGTGFHPELTGRENVFLNGAILGMSRAEIRRKFDEIVAFAEVERFLDTAVKFYSSGMYMRLAFAVAAHLDPEILVVDEVLAVGDAAFQEKCLGKMGEVARGGRTVLFVSHNAHAVRALCGRAVLLHGGSVQADGPALEVLGRYEREGRAVRVEGDTAVRDRNYRRGSGEVRFTSIEVVDARGRPRHEFEPGEAVRFALAYECRSDVSGLSVAVALKHGGELLTTTYHCLSDGPLPRGATGRVTVELPENPLRPGEYPLYFWLGRSPVQPFDVVDNLTAPLVIYSSRSADELGYDPTVPSGCFSVQSRLLNTETPNGVVL